MDGQRISASDFLEQRKAKTNRRRPLQRELVLQRQIWQWLTRKGAFVWIDYQPLSKNRSWQHLSSVGVSDILGIYKGVPLAIEVKWGRNKATEKQIAFQEEFRKNGGIAFVANSIEEVEKKLSTEVYKHQFIDFPWKHEIVPDA